MNKAGKNTPTTSTNAKFVRGPYLPIKGSGPLKHVYSIELSTRAMRPNASATAWAEHTNGRPHSGSAHRVHDRHAPIGGTMRPANIGKCPPDRPQCHRRGRHNPLRSLQYRSGTAPANPPPSARGLMRHRGIAVERLLLNTKNTMLNLIAIGSPHRHAAPPRRPGYRQSSRRSYPPSATQPSKPSRPERSRARQYHAPAPRYVRKSAQKSPSYPRDLDRKKTILRQFQKYWAPEDNGQDNGNGITGSATRVDAERQRHRAKVQAGHSKTHR